MKNEVRTSRGKARAIETAAWDPRRERTRSLLAGAVLSFARERDISSASIAELTRKAGVYRTTFYSHAETPVDLLVKVLSRELDAVRQEGLSELEKGGQLLQNLSHRLLGEVAAHAVKHEAIYASADRAASVFSLRTVLAEHIEASIALYLRKGFLSPPSMQPEDTAVYSAFLAHGIAGAVEAWLRRPAPRDREQLLTAIEATLPPWYAPETSPLRNQTGSGQQSHAASLPPKSRRKKRESGRTERK